MTGTLGFHDWSKLTVSEVIIPMMGGLTMMRVEVYRWHMTSCIQLYTSCVPFVRRQVACSGAVNPGHAGQYYQRVLPAAQVPRVIYVLEES